MKSSERKQKLVEELANLHEKLNVQQLYGFPSQSVTQDWLAEIASVLKNLDEGDYQEIVRLSKTIAPTESREKRKSAAHEIDSFLRRKVAEWQRYDFSSLDEEQNTRVIDNDFRIDKHINAKPNFSNITISGGTVIFGDGNKITQVAVKELVDALSEEINEKVPAGQEKENVLQSLKKITTNETFASVAGTVIGEILRRVTRP